MCFATAKNWKRYSSQELKRLNIKQVLTFQKILKAVKKNGKVIDMQSKTIKAMRSQISVQSNKSDEQSMKLDELLSKLDRLEKVVETCEDKKVNLGVMIVVSKNIYCSNIGIWRI